LKSRFFNIKSKSSFEISTSFITTCLCHKKWKNLTSIVSSQPLYTGLDVFSTGTQVQHKKSYKVTNLCHKIIVLKQHFQNMSQRTIRIGSTCTAISRYIHVYEDKQVTFQRSSAYLNINAATHC